MDAEEIAAKDQKFRDNLKYLDEMPQTQKALEMMLRMGNETKEEKEERQKMMREMRDELKTKEEIDREEKKKLDQKEKMEKMLKTVVRCSMWMPETKLTSAPRLISCNQLSRFLEVMADLIPNEKGSEGEVDYRRQIKCIDSVEFDKRLHQRPGKLLLTECSRQGQRSDVESSPHQNPSVHPLVSPRRPFSESEIPAQ
ncbi:hypothetical protein CRE_07932 [Caenorhabditis remanei]|uniref:Uncharacterized protein n=1 Tax=Caenorhabditis remanei TaxID=31234 RepID=E3NR81_CAERE|nr:hypothetical protein CRE_07932 [Caenorhabditis remanei]